MVLGVHTDRRSNLACMTHRKMLRRPLSCALLLFMLKGMSTRPATRLNKLVVPTDPGISCERPMRDNARAIKNEKQKKIRRYG